MNSKLAGWDDTIVALATPPGTGALGVIRISGTRSIDIANDLFPSKNLQDFPSHTLHVGFLKNGGKILDEVVLSLYRTPKSFTGENSIEISCHGSPYIQEQIIAACIEKGARLARAGEFTQRAFLNGKLDLTQAEAVADLIASNTKASLKTALTNIRGGFSIRLRELRERLITFSALIELELDFSQEDVEFADRTQLVDLVQTAISDTQRLVDSFKLGNVIKNGVNIAIIGKPNAGKSTLLNALLNEDRAIVSDIPGTTRDTIEELLNIQGILFRLIDTAGIRSHSDDLIESVGIQKSLKKMKEADIVLYLFDVMEETPETLQLRINEFHESGIRYVLIGNKMDQIEMENLRQKFPVSDVLFISSRDQINLDELKTRLVSMVSAKEMDLENVIITNVRHYNALKAMNQSLTDILEGINNKTPGDLLALDIRLVLQHLGEITGEITHEDQLNYIFSKFCIGK
jgi:tRNA modification GTPase